MLHAQPGMGAGGARDTLDLNTFQRRVLANHPELTQLRNEQAQARRLVTVAKGAFDPKVSASLADKRYKSEQYYRFTDIALSIPTLVGADFKLGFERGVGSKINPERSTSNDGLFTLGVQIPLGRNLITDERRTLLTRARAVSDIADADAIAATNKLLTNASKAYGEWYLANRKLVIADSGVRLATFRLESVMARIRAGESAAIDSVEARLEVRRRQVALLEAQNELQIAGIEASAFLWTDRAQPARLGTSLTPALTSPGGAETDTTALAGWIASAQRDHPTVRKADAKIAIESAELKLARQGLLPNLDVAVSALANGGTGVLQPSQWNDNFKSTASASTALLLRKERGKLQASALKMESARLERSIGQQRVAIEIQNALGTLIMLETAERLQRDNVVSAGMLRDAEDARFVLGESTLLAVNIRERFLLDELVKLEQFRAKLLSAGVALTSARGVPPG
ncbi:MAG: TolC family protein [Gemmatimonadaceae bacterium]